MQNISRLVRTSIQLLLILTLVLGGVTGCRLFNIASGPEPLPAVSPLPLPQLPDWIEQISPTGETEPLSQVRIRFKHPLIPVENLDSPRQQELLQKFEIVPPLPGKFRFLTPRMVGFQADEALPKATRVRVTLKSGLADLANHRLTQDLVWTFNTEPIQLTNLPGVSLADKDTRNQPIDIKPTLRVTSNVELDLDSLSDRLQLIPQGTNKTVPLKVELQEDNRESDYNNPRQEFDPSRRNWVYSITPEQILAKDKNYRLEIAAGLRPLRGNLLSEIPFRSRVKTYAPLKFEAIELLGMPDGGGAYGRFVNGGPELRFNNGLVANSAIENIGVNPAPKESPQLVRAYENSQFVSLNPWALEPATTYRIMIDADLRDRYGQSLGKPATLTYKTGDLAPDIWAPSGLNIFPANTDLQLNISTVNLPDKEYRAVYEAIEPTDLVYRDSAYPSGRITDLIPSSNTWQTFPVSGKKNQLVDAVVPLREKLGAATGMLAYGVRARTNSYQVNGRKKWREPEYYGLVQLTNLGVFAQWFPDSGLVQVNHLDDGSSVANSTIEIYRSQLDVNSSSAPRPCATGQTDGTGLLLLNSQNLRQCMGGNKFSQPPELLVIARENRDWAYTRTWRYSGAYGYGLNSRWDEDKIQSRGTIFSDRSLYKPGEKAAFTGVAYTLQNGTINRVKNAAYSVTLQSPDGEKKDLGTRRTNDFGTFSLEVPLDPNQSLGYYQIRGRGNNGTEISGRFRVAEFKPPNFKVELKLDREFAFVKDKVEAIAESNYLFGAPVEGGEASYYITRSQTNFTPKGWEKFNFGPQWFWPEERPVIQSDVLQITTLLDDEGKGKQILTVDKDLLYPMVYRVDVEVSDVSNLSVADSQTFVALPSDKLIGLKSQFVANAGEGFPVEVIVSDARGKAIANQNVHLELQRMKYSRVTQLIEGSQTEKNQVEYETVNEVDLKSGTTPKTAYLTPTESGSYRIRANFSRARNKLAVTDAQIWATGGSRVFWGSEENLEIKLDKDTYKPGEIATALIQSPYDEAELFFAVVRDKFLYRTVTNVRGGAPQIQFKVTPEMLPNAAVEAVLVRRGPSIETADPKKVEDLVKIGLTPFKVDLGEKYLNVGVTPSQEKTQPGGEQTVRLQLKDAEGKPVRGQVTVMVVNEAVLQLTGYRPPDLVDIVYAEQPISTRFSDNRPDVELAALAEPLKKGWGYGGGRSSGAAGTRIRKDFQALAYYNGSVITDAKGNASITFKLPDDLTTWRVMAVATDEQMRFGNGDATFITTKPLLSNPLLPQFVRKGDRFDGGLSVTNNTGKAGNLDIRGSLGKTVEFTDNNRLRTKIETGTRAYRFPMKAVGVGEGTVQFTAQMNRTADAFEVPLEVKELQVTEQVVESGTTENRITIPVNVGDRVRPDAGGLDISLASTLILEITAPAKQVFRENQLPFAEPAASQLAISSNLQTLGEKYNQTFSQFNPEQQATQALGQLQKLQKADGGFARWPGQAKSDPFITPYVAKSLAKARQAFPQQVKAGMISEVKDYLSRILANPGRYDYCQSQLCKNQVRLETLIALAELGDKRNEFLTDLYQQRDEFDLTMQLKLGRYLSEFPEWEAEAKTIAQQLQEIIYETGRTAKVNLPQTWRWMSSPTTAQAQALQLLIAQNSPPEVLDRVLTGLLAMRQGTWGSTYNNAQALTALVSYSELQPTLPNFTAVVQLAGKTLGESRFVGYRNPSQELNVPMAKLPRGDRDLILEKSGEGTLHYLTAYRYRLEGNQPGRLNGLRVSREVRPAGEDEVLRRIGLFAADDPLKVPAGRVYDIGLEIISDRPVDHVVIADHLPAGFEAVDASFQTTTQAVKAKQDSWEIGYQTIYGDRIVAYADRLDAGVYTLHYLVRSVTPGTFLWPGAEAYLQYAPEEFGRSASSILEVKD